MSKPSKATKEAHHQVNLKGTITPKFAYHDSGNFSN